MKRWIDKKGNFWNGKSIVLDMEVPDSEAIEKEYRKLIDAAIKEAQSEHPLTPEQVKEIISHIEKPMITKTVAMRVFNPTDEQLIAAGYTEYVEPEPTVAQLKQRKCNEIDSYDSSSAVNEFFINNQSLWLDKSTRAGLLLRIESEMAAGKETTTLWYGTTSFTIPIDKAKELLYGIELYASQCFDNTAQHKLNVMNLKTKKTIEAYDYTTGYPEKLSLDITV